MRGVALVAWPSEALVAPCAERPMPIHLHRDLESISRQIIEVGSLVEDSVNKAIEAVIHRRTDLAEEVIALDARIDELEVELEESVLKALALHQPVAGDLRYLISVLKLNNDLERMGDGAVTMAERALALAKFERLDVDINLQSMSDLVREMVRGCLDALVMRSASHARRVLAQDDRVDDEHRRNFSVLISSMKLDPENVDRAVNLMSVSRALERVADLATNVAEDVIFLVEGEVVRHRLAWAKEGRLPKTSRR